VGDVTDGIANDASLGDRPVAGKTGTSENFFDAWFIGYTPQLVTGTWMGYAEGTDTLEYVLAYARKLNGLPGGVTPAQIWQTYTKQVLEDEPLEQFEGVKLPEKDDEKGAPGTTMTTGPGATKAPGAVRNRPGANQGARQQARAQRRAAAASSASASSVSQARSRRSRAGRAAGSRAATLSSVAPSSASPSSAAPR
jgi:membrane peptidoglycan carboxypeptidase